MSHIFFSLHSCYIIASKRPSLQVCWRPHVIALLCLYRRYVVLRWCHLYILQRYTIVFCVKTTCSTQVVPLKHTYACWRVYLSLLFCLMLIAVHSHWLNHTRHLSCSSNRSSSIITIAKLYYEIPRSANRRATWEKRQKTHRIAAVFVLIARVTAAKIRNTFNKGRRVLRPLHYVQKKWATNANTPLASSS